MEHNESRPDVPMWCVTFPWEVPPNTIIVERSQGRWRVVSLGRPVAFFRRRDDALGHARRIAAVFVTPFRIIELDDESDADALAG
jgi:hypothetical protein